jgi:uncharacterized Ntn-hydrolase superfamily protein
MTADHRQPTIDSEQPTTISKDQIMSRALLPIILLFATVAVAAAQDTFSIVAIDPVTGEVGSAGASCVAVDVALISDVAPGVGAVHTQAYYIPANQTIAGNFLRLGYPAATIVDSVVANDAASQPEIRQYGAVTLADGGTSAAYTGTGAQDYKGHRLGPTYAIQGNILLGRGILDSMEARFLRTPGPLADRLMAALQGANVPGADSRCLADGLSSLASFIRVARPGDAADKLYLDLRAFPTPGLGIEPIDTLQNLFDKWKLSTGDVRSRQERELALRATPNPAAGNASITFSLTRRSNVALSLYDQGGREIMTREYRMMEPGEKELGLSLESVPPGSYYLLLNSEATRATCRLVVGDRSK